MDRHSIIFVTDDRLRYLSECLSVRTETVTIEEAAEQSFCEERVAAAERIILPVPVQKVTKLPEFERIKSFWNPQQLVFGGVFPEALGKELKERRIPYFDLMKEESVTVKNAAVTAEAVTAEVICRSKYSVDGQKIVITGYGRCARAAAEKLSALGARITVLARDRKARKEAQAKGYCAVDFAYGPEEVCAAATVINTVPAPVVTERMLREMHPGTLLLDLASAPGGYDVATAERYGLNVILLPGLPGRYTAKSSAKILADAIRQKTYSITGRKEERTWIFQILLSDMASPVPSVPSPAPGRR